MPKTKLKGIRKAILEELGVQDICTARIFAVKSDDAEPLKNASEQEE